MNEFYIQGVVLAIKSKVTKGGKEFKIVRVKADDGEIVPLPFWSQPPQPGQRVSVIGRLTSYGDFVSVKVDEFQVIPEHEEPAEKGAAMTHDPLIDDDLPF